MRELEIHPQLSSYFAQLEQIARDAGDAKLEALEPFMRSRAPAVAESLPWHVFARVDESDEPIKLTAHFGGFNAEAQFQALERQPRSGIHSLVVDALCGSLLGGVIRKRSADPLLPGGGRSYRLELESGADPAETLKTILLRVHGASNALAVRSALELLSAYETGELYPFLRIVAESAILKASEGSNGVPPPVDMDVAAKDLTNEVLKALPKLRSALGPAPQLESEALKADKTGEMLQLDAAFADFVETCGARGRKNAALVRQKSRERWQRQQDLLLLWVDPSKPAGARWISQLADALWLDRVQPQTTRLERNSPALAYFVHEDVVRIHSRAYKVEDKQGQQALVFDEGDPIILTPAMAEDAMRELVHKGTNLLGSVTAHRALRWEVSNGYERVMRGEADARTLTVDGGWSVFASELGLTKKQHAEDLKAIIHAQAAVMITLPDGTRGNMLALRDSPAAGRRRGRVEIVLGTMLLPHYVYELKEHMSGRALREGKRLVPVAQLPPFVGRPNDHGAQATASMLVMRELRSRAAELFREGAVRIELERWSVLFHEARLPASMIGKVLDRWTRDGTDGPAFLRSPERYAYTLGDAYEQALTFLIESGKREAEGSEGGKRSVQNRAAKRARTRLG